MRVFTREKQQRLVWAAHRVPEPSAFGIIFALFIGLRIGELSALQWKNVSPATHSFRGCATRSLEQGMDVVTLSRLLGHASPSITLDKYGHALDDQKKRSVEKLNEIYCPAGKRIVPQTRESISQARRTAW